MRREILERSRRSSEEGGRICCLDSMLCIRAEITRWAEGCMRGGRLHQHTRQSMSGHRYTTTPQAVTRAPCDAFLVHWVQFPGEHREGRTVFIDRALDFEFLGAFACSLGDSPRATCLTGGNEAGYSDTFGRCWMERRERDKSSERGEDS